LLGNRIYNGEVVHKGNSYPGEHQAIVDKELWGKVQSILSENTRAKQTKARSKMISPLQGVIRCGHCDILGCRNITNLSRNWITG